MLLWDGLSLSIGRGEGEIKDLRKQGGNDSKIIGCREEESKNVPTAVY